MEAFYIYNTATRAKQVFVPGDPGRVVVYLCGPTVYSYAHIGNARSAIVGDIMVRTLRTLYPNVFFMRNFTDVDDKIIQEARKQGGAWQDIATRFERIYREDMGALGLLEPTLCPRATEHIADIIAMISALIEKGFAYEAQGHVLFHVPAFSTYGGLSHRSRADMLDGARVEVAPYKKDAADFVLWKPSQTTDPSEPAWPSPWGNGRPGWHIECSAMIARHAGETIDIHMGGQDLIFPHHENECAQSSCAHGGRPLARFWVHNGFVNVRSEKMSKSLHNVLLVHDLLQETDAFTLRLALLSTHYRQPLDWNDQTLQLAGHNAARLREAYALCMQQNAQRVSNMACRQALYDDLNVPLALTKLMQLAKHIRAEKETNAAIQGQFLDACHILGLDAVIPEPQRAVLPEAEHQWVEQQLAIRQEHKARKEYAQADAIRQQLLTHGIHVIDKADGSYTFATTKPPI